MVQRYKSHFETDDPSTSSLQKQKHHYSSKHSQFLTCKELLQIVESEEALFELNVMDLVHLEKQLETALIQTRTAKTDLLLDSLTSLYEKEKMLEEEKQRLLNDKIAGNKAPFDIDLNVKPSL